MVNALASILAMVGILVFILLYGVTQSIMKWILIKLGYSMGLSFIDTVFSSGLIAHATQCGRKRIH